MRPRLFPVMGVALLAGLLASVLASVFGFVPTLLAAAAPGSWRWLIHGLGAIPVSIVVRPFVTIVATLLYFDGRIRNEGMDLEIMAANLSAG